RARSQIMPSMVRAAAIALAAFAGYWSQIDRQWLRIPGAPRGEQAATQATTGAATAPPAGRGGPSAVDDRTSKIPSTNPDNAAALPTGTAESAARSQQRPEALMDGDSLSPAFALVGTAMFYQGEDALPGGLVRVGNDG